MIRRLINNKGAIPVIAIIIAAVVVAVVAGIGFLTDGFGLGGGQGDGLHRLHPPGGGRRERVGGQAVSRGV